MMHPDEVRERLTKSPPVSVPGDRTRVSGRVEWHATRNEFWFVVITTERLAKAGVNKVREHEYSRTRYRAGTSYYSVWCCDEAGPRFVREVGNIRQAYYWRDKLALTI